MTTAQKRIAGAFVVGLGLIILAFILSTSQAEPEQATVEPVVVASAEPRDYIAVTDEDNDGIPDWQEALQQTEPVILETGNEYEIPDTLTDKFAIQFFQDMVRAENSGPFGNDPEALAEQATAKFQDQVTDELFTNADIIITSDNSKKAIKDYVLGLKRIILSQPVPIDTPSELSTLEKAYRANDPAELEALRPIVEAYKNIIEDGKKLPVPSSFAALHLDYLNATNAVYNDILAMEQAFSDPLYTLLRLKRYAEDQTAVEVILIEINKKMSDNGVVISPEDLGQ